MTNREDAVREAIRLAYVAGEESVPAIAARFGVPLRKIYTWRQTEAWPRRTDRTADGPKADRRRPVSASARTAAKHGETIAAPAETKPEAAAKRSRPARGGKRALITRLYKAIDAKLKQLETSMSTSDPPNAADTERETRALGTLIRNVEKVGALEADVASAAQRAAAGNSTPKYSDVGSNSGAAGLSTLGDDQDRLRRELADRIRRVRERHVRPGD